MAAPNRPGRPALLPMALRPWVGGVLISFSGVWVRLADTEVFRSAFLRTAYALPVLVVMLLVARRRSLRLAATSGRTLGPRWLLPLGLVSGVFLGIDLITWHASMGILGAGLGTVIPNLQVVVVGLAGVVLFRERPRPAFWFALPVVLAGVALLGVVGRPVDVSGSVPVGIALGVSTAVLYAFSLIVLRVARRRTPEASGIVVLFSMTLGATLVTGAVAAFEGVAGPAGWPADGWLVLLALGSQVVGWSLLTSSIAQLPAALTSVALLIQPALGMAWGALLLGEPLGPPQVAGAAVLLVGIVLAQRAVGSGARPRGALDAPRPATGASDQDAGVSEDGVAPGSVPPRSAS